MTYTKVLQQKDGLYTVKIVSTFLLFFTRIKTIKNLTASDVKFMKVPWGKIVLNSDIQNDIYPLREL